VPDRTVSQAPHGIGFSGHHRSASRGATHTGIRVTCRRRDRLFPKEKKAMAASTSRVLVACIQIQVCDGCAMRDSERRGAAGFL